jgi:hypothetical protein
MNNTRQKAPSMISYNTVEIYIPLLEEGTDTLRPTQAVPLGNNLYKILPTPNYDPEDEVWEFLPGSTVRCEKRANESVGELLRAVEKVG